MNHAMPRARQEELLVHELTDEVLVYDLKRHKAHSLNRTSVLVWKRCDGASSAAEIARLLEEELGASIDEDVVWLALKQLDEAHLLGEASPRVENSGVSRREVMRRLGRSAAAALPMVTSILAPTKVQAGSCIAAGGGMPCTSTTNCCSTVGNCTSGNPASRVCK